MAKMKSHSGARKRLKLTAKGKIKMHSPSKSHLMTCKTAKRKRNLRKPKITSSVNIKRLVALIS